MRALILGITGVGLLALPALAQDAALEDTSIALEPSVIEIKQADIAPLETYPEGFSSLFYTDDEYALLLESLRVRVAPSRRKSDDDKEDLTFLPPPPPKIETPPPKILHLSGIIYTSPKDWTLWLNGQRVVPGKLPDHARAMSVTKEYADIKWHDTKSNQIFSVRMRPHQRFNIDTRTFMPGAAFSGSTEEEAGDMTRDGG